MRILIISQYFWPESFRINDVAKLLIKNDVELVVLTGCPNYPNGTPFDRYNNLRSSVEAHPDGYSIYRVPLALRKNATSLRLISNYLSFIVNGIIFGSLALRREKFDLIFVYAPSPILQVLVGIYFKYSRNVPLITWVQDLWPDSLKFTGHISNKTILSGVEKIVSWIYQKNDLLLAQSRSFVESIEKKAKLVKVIYFPTPGEVEVEPSPGDDFSRNEFFLEQGFNIVFAGNLGTVQSLPMILSAAEILHRYSHIRILLVGSGSLTTWLESEIKSRELNNVILMGRYPPEVMPKIFQCASALLVSLIGDPILNQTIPAKLQSYLAAGKPIIASLDGEGAQIVLNAGAGLVCPTENPNALSDSILELSRMSQTQLELMGASGRRYYEENFEPQALVRELVNIFNGAIIKHSKI
jgi:glycosyltransferase involved in cell wall biosynthesis